MAPAACQSTKGQCHTLLVSLSFSLLWCSLFLDVSRSFCPSPSLSFSLFLVFPLSLSPIGCFGVWFRVLAVCRLERTDSFVDVSQEEWERRVSLVIIR